MTEWYNNVVCMRKILYIELRRNEKRSEAQTTLYTHNMCVFVCEVVSVFVSFDDKRPRQQTEWRHWQITDNTIKRINVFAFNFHTLIALMDSENYQRTFFFVHLSKLPENFK